MEAALHKTVNRPAPAQPAPAAFVRAPAGVAPRQSASSSRTLESPYITRFAGSITQMQGRAATLAGAREADGTHLYRTGDGQVVALPEGMTAEHAAQLEAEAKAAEKKLGQGPPPRPVPDVKKLVAKPPRKAPVQPLARARQPDGTRGKPAGAAAAGLASVGLLRAVGSSKVAQYLAQRGASVLHAGIGLLQTLRHNEQTHDSPTDKLAQSEKAVVIPPSEGQSKSNAAQVTTVDSRTAPVADEKTAKDQLAATLAQSAPQRIADVDNFKHDQKARHAGAEVLKIVQGESNAVTSTFEDVTRAPPPAPPEHAPAELPPAEPAPATAQMNLGRGAIAPLQNDHTDVSKFTKGADGKLMQEGVSQEQLDMVDRGDLAAANKEKKGLEARARTEPLAVQRFAAHEAQAIEQQLQHEEKTSRDAMRAKRTEALHHTAQAQRGTRTALERKRDEVASRINGIYQSAQDKVKKKLADLETESMKRFDAGSEAASKTFEDNVNRELDRIKAERYAGWLGWAKQVKDWVLGMDDVPEVKAIFDRHRHTFVATMNRLVASIAADQRRVIQECKNELANAKRAIRRYVDSLGPDLKDIGRKAAEAMTAKLRELDELVSRKADELHTRLKDKQAAAIKAIDQKIEDMKEAMSGALSRLGNFLLQAAKKFFTWALEKFGVSLSTIEGIINKGAAVLTAIFTAPIQFVKNLVKAASTGFENFGKHFLTHLKSALFAWLTGSLQGLVLPATWDFKGILSVVFQMLGITYANFRAHLVKLIPEPVVKTLETTFTLVKTLVTEGPMAAWEQLKEIASEMKDAFIDAVKDWLKWQLVQKAIETILSMLIPGLGLIRAIVGIYDTIVFFIQRAKDIMQMISDFLGSIAAIAAGNIGAAASALEAGLARGLALVIDFLARFLRLTGITRKIQEAIQKVRAKVDGVIAKVAVWIVAQAKKLGRLAASGAQRFVQWLRTRVAFTSDDGEQHTLYFEGSEANARLTIATTPVPVAVFLLNKQTEVNAPTSTLPPKEKSRVLHAITEARSILRRITRLTYPRDRNTPALADEANQVNQLMRSLSKVLKSIVINSGAVPRMIVVPGFSNNKANYLGVRYLFNDNDKTNHADGEVSRKYNGELSGAIPILIAMGVRHKWVAFHILHDKFGGKAVDSNLVPTPIGVNRVYRNSFEEKLLTAYRDPQGPKVLWMDATVLYRSDMPEFPESISVRGGHMKWNYHQNRWKKDNTTEVVKFDERSIPLPDLTTILINKIPNDRKGRAQFVKLSPMTRALLELIADSPRCGKFEKQRELIALVEAKVDPSRPQRAQYIEQIKKTPMDFKK